MSRKKLSAAIFSLGCIHASSTFALGLGDLKIDSFLNEPLKAEVDLVNVDGLHADQIRIRLATREDFERMGVDRAYFLTSIRFDVSVDAQGRGTISISSDDPVLEPYLDFIVEARWPSGRLLREYTVLVDPPLFDSSTPVVSASERVAEVEGTPLPDGSGKKSGGPAATSGTRVDVRNKSKLAPGAMPDRGFNAETSGAPRPGERYMIHRDDTLWEIAEAARPAGTSVHQTMLDIQRLNPDAFIGGNINRIKAGYIIYLPQEADISSRDLAEALAEVKVQNEDWQAGRASKPISSGPKLRISAEPTEEPAAAAGADASDYTAGGAPAGGEIDAGGSDATALSAELAAMEAQVNTLERIVSLKDDQIAALQAALKAVGGELPEMGAEFESVTEGAAPLADFAADEAADGGGETATGGGATGEAIVAAAEPAAEQGQSGAAEPGAAEPVAAAAVAERKPAPAKPAPAPAKPATVPADEGGMTSYLYYGFGALGLGLLAIFFLRRGKRQDAAGDEDVFADVELQEDAVEVLDEAEDAPEELEPRRDNRGYGERKHDEYAADMGAGDALAEADIYIAYGRYPQAKELLQNAINSEPGNPAYRLKLLETELQIGDRDAARAQLRELETLGDTASIARANELLGGGDSFTEPPTGLADAVEMETSFAGLKIEASNTVDDDLDLSADFDDDLATAADDEDLVIAAESNGMSTKLDLARAYLDMGDEDGARQILEEVITDGSGDQKVEAASLLDRIA